MTPYYADEWLTVWQGDCRAVMAEMEPESVHCVVTSPPYWGLRDYGSDGQLGLEPTPEAYVANMVEVFREVRRVLRADGTVWLNLGDSYAGYWGDKTAQREGRPSSANTNGWTNGFNMDAKPNFHVAFDGSKIKPKDLVGIPWRVAFALQADGWYLRSDIIWSKPNPMPESVTDRPTKSHEYLFLLTKSPRYYFDADAVREGYSDKTEWTYAQPDKAARAGVTTNGTGASTLRVEGMAGRNIRSVWTVATRPYPGAHFATFPEALIEPCVKAGTSERGVCPECGASWERVTESTGGETYSTGKSDAKRAQGLATQFSGYAPGAKPKVVTTTGWRPPDCGHYDHYTGLHAKPTQAVILDPFAGSGTTGRVAQRLGRRAVLIDLSADYLTQAMIRNQDIPLGLETA